MSVAASTVPASVAAWRTAPGVEAAWESEGGQLARLWLRGFSESEQPRMQNAIEELRAVPTARRARVTAEGLAEVRPDGSVAALPYRKTPSLRWRPLAEVLTVTPPEVSIADEVAPERMAWRLVPGDANRVPAALLTSGTHLAAFAKTAPLVRLERLRFCWVGQRALVLGTPLPPLPGEAFWGGEQLRPVGMDFEHPMLLGRLAPKPYGARPGDVTLWRADGGYVYLPGRAFVTLGRDNVDLERAAFVTSTLTTPPTLPS